MAKLIFILAACVTLLMGGGALVWRYGNTLRTQASVDANRVRYDAYVADHGGDELVIRRDLNRIVMTASCPFSASDQVKIDGLLQECLDANVLIQIDSVRAFIEADKGKQSRAYDFLSPDHRARLVTLAGESPSEQAVLKLRASLSNLALALAVVRQRPDWNVKIEGEVPPMPFLDLLGEGFEFLPPDSHPQLIDRPAVPIFCTSDAVLLEHVDRYFDTDAARASFPKSKFPKMYVGDRIAPVPTAIAGYRAEIAKAFTAEKVILLPGEKPDPEQVEAIDEIYRRLERVFEAVGAFGVAP